MLIDLNEWRPQNETQEHFFLKQVGRAYLFNQGIRCIATEVDGLSSTENPSFGSSKDVIDVLGINKKRKEHEPSRRLYEKIKLQALLYGQKQKIVRKREWGPDTHEFLSLYDIKSATEKNQLEAEIRRCWEKACKKFGHSKDLYQHLHLYYEDHYELRGIEVKVSYQDFKNGFNMLPEYTYVLAPVGIVPKNELPDKVGLLEFDFDSYQIAIEDEVPSAWEHALKVTKKPKKQYDVRFRIDKATKSYYHRDAHVRYCQKLLFRIAQQNTEEHIFWNPHIQLLKRTYLSSKWDYDFSLPIGQHTPLGTVVDRRFGIYTFTDEELKQRGEYQNKKSQRMPYYRFLLNGQLNKWTPWHKVERIILESKQELYKQKEAVSSVHDLYTLYRKCEQQGFVLFVIEDKKVIEFNDLSSYEDVTSLVKLLHFSFQKPPFA
ncbi:hypothetical protein CN918_25815 [Priestia megaterium]|nr:hypothetical protein CN918_25815 [Priestia megaterium]